jgi:hypothetical protein
LGFNWGTLFPLWMESVLHSKKVRASASLWADLTP